MVVRRRYQVTGQPRYRGFPLALTAGLLFIVALNVLLTRNVSAFLFKVAKVEGRAMSPTLEDQDRLIVSMCAYLRSAPRRGDVVMLRYPLNPDKMFVKRVIGEEGDQIVITDGRVVVNDILQDERHVAEDARSHDHYGPAVVPQRYYFVLGDRRNNSSDSRHWGFVPAKYIVGKVVYRWWPLGTAGRVR